MSEVSQRPQLTPRERLLTVPWANVVAFLRAAADFGRG